MNDLAQALFERAETTLLGARALVPIDTDGAAFHAVSAFFAERGSTFVKHSALEAAVHRDLVLTGIWPKQLGADYSYLARLRKAGDYGGQMRVSEESAAQAANAAERIVAAVRNSLE